MNIYFKQKQVRETPSPTCFYFLQSLLFFDKICFVTIITTVHAIILYNHIYWNITWDKCIRSNFVRCDMKKQNSITFKLGTIIIGAIFICMAIMSI